MMPSNSDHKSNTPSSCPAASSIDDNMHRCQAMQECQSQLEYWKQRYKKLQNEHKAAGILATIATKPDAWERLPRSQKWNKEYVLAVYQAHTKHQQPQTALYPLPNLLREPWRSVPNRIKEDWDIFLARLKSPHCIRCYTIYYDNRLYWDSPTTARTEFETMLDGPKYNTEKEKWNTHPDILEILIESYTPRVDPLILRERIIPNTTTTAIDWNMAGRFLNALKRAWKHAKQSLQREDNEKDDDDEEPFVPDRSYYEEVLSEHIPQLWIHGFPFQVRNDAQFLARYIFSSLDSNHNENDHPNRNELDWGFCEFVLTFGHSVPRLVNEKSEDEQLGKTTLRNNKWFAMKILEIARNHRNSSSCCCNGEGEEKSQVKTSKHATVTTSPSSSSVPDHALSLFSKRLKDDTELVMAMVQQNGMNLKYASYRCRRHSKIVQAAIQNQSRAILYALSKCYVRIRFVRQHNVVGIQRVRTLFRDILSHRKQQYKLDFTGCRVNQTVQAVYSQYFPTLALERKIWKELHPKIRADIELSAIALSAGIIALEELKPSLQESLELWKFVLAENDSNWFSLPLSLQDNIQLVESITRFTDQDLVEELLLYRFPNELASNRLFWTRLVSSPGLETYSLWLDHASPEFRRDREFAILACSHDLEYWEFFKEQMPEDRDVFAAAIRCTPEALLVDVSPVTQHLFPELVAEAIRKYKTDDIWDIFDCVDDGLWHVPDIVHAWVERGGDYLHEEFPESFEHDEELFLLIAEHNPSDFWCASESLCKKKDFMLKVVAKKAILIKEAAGERLKNDFDLALVAFSGTENGGCELAGTYDIHDKDQFQFITNFATNVREQLQLHGSFVQLLCAMTFAQARNSVKPSSETIPPLQDCQLFMLNQGKETSIAYRKLFAEFLNVPTGERLRMLRQASKNLERWGY